MKKAYKNILFFLIPWCFFSASGVTTSPKITPHQHREPSTLEEKDYYSCRDALLNASTFGDVALNMIWIYVYTICTMEMGLQSYVKRIEKQASKTERDRTLLHRAKSNLLRIQKILPSYLEAFRCAIKEFSEGNLRQKLDQMKLDHIRKMGGNAEKKLMR